ncbi:MAG: Gfo/Idh/MocA family oxidoreductase [Bacteroidota bacterium]
MGKTVGLVGAGSIVAMFYIRVLKSLGFTSILLYDIDTAHAQQVANQHQVHQVDLATIVQQANIIIVATPPHTHFDLLQQLITKGKTIICEKPFVYLREHAEALVKQAQQNEAKLYVAHIRRFFPGIALAKEYIANNETGKLLKATLCEGGRFSYKTHSGYVFQNPYGGVLLDTGSHVLDSFLYVTGLTKTPINCTVQQAVKDKAEPAHEVAYTFHINDIPVSLKLSRLEPLANKITLYYEFGIIEVPLGIKPNISITTPNGHFVVSAAHSCISYMSEAFKQELDSILVKQEANFLEAADFINLSMILETLYKA